MAMTDEEAFELWAMHMRAAGCTNRTLSERRFLLLRLGRDLGHDVVTATRNELIAWLGRPDLSPKTRQNYRSAVHTFFTLLQDEEFRHDNPAARLPRGKSPRVEANPFSTAEVQKLLDSGIYGRSRMMVLLAAYQGFRAVEIAATSGAHVDWDRSMILTVEAKGGVEVWRPLHPAVIAYAQAKPDMFPRDGFWFPGIGPNRGYHIAAKSVSNTLSQALARADIRHRPHQLRAWFATELSESGADMLTIQHAMRHATAGTLKHYIRPSMNRIQEGIQRLPALEAPMTTGRTRGGRA